MSQSVLIFQRSNFRPSNVNDKMNVPDERIDITKKNEHLVLTDSQPIICHKMTNEAPLMFSLPVIMKSISYWMNALMPTAGNFVAFLMLVLLHSSVTQFRTDLLEHSHDQQKKVLMSPDELTELLNFYHSTPICGYHTCQDLARLHMEWCKRCYRICE
ncbi:hypothetical protein LSH36_1757g00010 [Paralvinella palmiformis]|uniref:Uncharacterized protein n=1 Tax=Paralvinella palmiformis TaxID=53620 RepID=A0AAD9ISD0_9ANNE|nr:hypothetical protein LSH36_1757g00010 [Paralvinella palmiformis]